MHSLTGLESLDLAKQNLERMSPKEPELEIAEAYPDRSAVQGAASRLKRLRLTSIRRKDAALH
jgi:hypothetical protein